MSETLREYLVGLGFKIEESSFRRFNDAIAHVHRHTAELGAATISTAAAIEQSVRTATENYEDLYFAAQRISASVRSLQTFSYASSQIGLSVGQAQSAIEGFGATLRMQPWTKGLLAQLGVDTHGDTKKTFDSFIDRMAALSNRGPRFYGLAVRYGERFGIGERELFSYIKNRGVERREEADYNRRLNEAGINSDAAAERFRQFGIEVRRLESDFGILGQRLGIDWVDAAEKVVKTIDQIVQMVNRADAASGGWGLTIETIVTTALGAWIAKLLVLRPLMAALGLGGAAEATAAGAAAGAVAKGSRLGRLGRLGMWGALGRLGMWGALIESVLPTEANGGENTHSGNQPLTAADFGMTGRNLRDAVAAPAADALGNVQGMNVELVERLRKMREAMPGGSFRINSGFRTFEQQARERAAHPDLAARPGHSSHERGLAADLGFSSATARAWANAHAAEFGLTFPVAGEPWHAEALGITRGAIADAQRRGAPSATINQSTTINVTSSDPAAAGKAVAAAQTRVIGDLVRNTIGVMR